MACETNIWSDIRQALLLFDRDYHSTRIENALSAGVPDVTACLCGIEHWIEIKGLRRWPMVAADRIIHLDHPMLPSQQRWHKARWLAGGNCWVVLGIREPEREWLIWPGPIAAVVLTEATKSQLIKSTSVHAHGAFPSLEFLKVIRLRATERR